MSSSNDNIPREVKLCSSPGWWDNLVKLEGGTGWWGNPDNRTPRKFKFMEPDVTVVVGGVEFYHYRAILCSNCEFFDQMLSSQMRESGTGVIELPDMDPERWLEFYRFLDPMNYAKVDHRVSGLLHGANVHWLLNWFDYFGMDQHMLECDKYLSRMIRMNQLTVSHNLWQRYEHMPSLKETKGTILSKVKGSARVTIRGIATKTNAKPEMIRQDEGHEIIQKIVLERRDKFRKEEAFEDLKKFLLDEECGDEMWNHFIGDVVNLPKEMLDTMDRHSILSADMFKYLATVALRPQYAKPTPPKKKSFLDSSSEEESSDDDSTAPPRRRAPAPAPAPRPAQRRNFFDSDSDDDSDSS